jgi:hypothetical protein
VSLLDRLRNVAYAEDEAANAALGGKPTETLSGSVGRAAAAGDWWAVHVGEPLVNWLMGSATHCQDAAAAEARRRAADPNG